MDRQEASKFMHSLLELMVKQKASDLFITAGFPPALKIDGRITPVAKQPSASRSVRGSCPLRYSPLVDGSAIGGAITRLRRSASNLSAGVT